jgi:tRNA/rRNA methyltransferase
MSKEKIMPAVILVRPQMGENIGAAARAMANFGLNGLVLVAPRDGWPSAPAKANAVGAFDHLKDVRVAESVKEAVAPYHLIYATTARPRDMNKRVLSPPEAVHDMDAATSETKAAILFGGERAGLSNEDISFANDIITFPTNPAFSSLNLAQSVLLVCYEYARTQEQKNQRNEIDAPASQELLNGFLGRLDNELERGHFFRSADMKPTMWANIRAVFTRARPSVQEVATLQGILSALIGNKEKRRTE